jgi:hypothetical protein
MITTLHHSLALKEFCIFQTHGIYVIYMILAVENSDFPKEIKPAGLCNEDLACFISRKPLILNIFQMSVILENPVWRRSQIPPP